MSNNQVQYTSSGSFAGNTTHTLTLSDLPTHTHTYMPAHSHGGSYGYSSACVVDPAFSSIHVIGNDGLSYTIGIQDIIKKLRLEPDTNVKPKRCYE